jgi:hypothetical protein
MVLVLLEEAPGQTGRQAVEDTRWQLEDRAEARLKSCRTSSVDHHYLMDQVRILMC